MSSNKPLDILGIVHTESYQGRVIRECPMPEV